MHIEIRIKGKKKKYYLAQSYRQENKVRKVRVYLGSDLSESERTQKRREAEAKIKEKISKAKAIGDPYVTALSDSELEELATLEAKGEFGIKHLSEEEWIKFTEAFTYDTNAIEGSTVQPGEVAEILEKKKWPRDRTKEEIAETYGVAEAIRYIRKTKIHVSIKLILEMHKIVFKNSKHFAGQFRKRGIEVVIADRFGNIVHRGVPSTEVRLLIRELVLWYSKNKSKYPPIVLAAVMHNQFENIHPFQDGNGRVGRLLLNNILIKNGLPPLNIELRNRAQYYQALQAYEKSHDIRPMLELMLDEYRSLKKLMR